MARLEQVRKVRWRNKILVIFVWTVLVVATNITGRTLSVRLKLDTVKNNVNGHRKTKISNWKV
jgi:hypothetical protein